MGRDLPGEANRLKQLTKDIVELLDRGEARVAEKRDDYPCRLHITQVGQSNKKNDKVQEVNRLLSDEDFFCALKAEMPHSDEFEEERITGKRIYRRKEDLPDPSKPRWAAVNRSKQNRSKKAVSLRLEPDILEIIDQAVSYAGTDRTRWMTAAFLKVAVDQGIDIPEEFIEQLDCLSPDPG